MLLGQKHFAGWKKKRELSNCSMSTHIHTVLDAHELMGSQLSKYEKQWASGCSPSLFIRATWTWKLVSSKISKQRLPVESHRLIDWMDDSRNLKDLPVNCLSTLLVSKALEILRLSPPASNLTPLS